MNRVRSACRSGLMLAGASILMSGAGSVVAAQSLPTPTALMARHDSAVGGRAVLASHSSMRMVGALSIAMAGIEAPFEILKRSPNTYLFRSSLGPVGDILQGFDGTTAWTIQPGAAPAILEGQSRDQLATQADFFADLHDASKFSAMTTVGEIDFEGKRCYEVRFTRLNGTSVTEYFDKATGLSAGGLSSADTPMGAMQQVSVYSDYKEFGGMRFATRIVQRNPQYEMVLSISAIEFDNVDAAAVALPDAVKALIKQ